MWTPKQSIGYYAIVIKSLWCDIYISVMNKGIRLVLCDTNLQLNKSQRIICFIFCRKKIEQKDGRQARPAFLHSPKSAPRSPMKSSMGHRLTVTERTWKRRFFPNSSNTVLTSICGSGGNSPSSGKFSNLKYRWSRGSTNISEKNQQKGRDNIVYILLGWSSGKH